MGHKVHLFLIFAIFIAADASQDGALKVSHTLLGPIEKGDDAEAITKEEFVELCGRAASRRQGLKPEDDSANPEGERELSMDEVLKLIPPELYDGITGAPDDVIEARRDREKGLLSSLRMAATEAEARGDSETAAKLDRDAISVRRYFYDRAGANLTK
jgi:hypothetical protein